jgi:two-component system nitrogen regulation response regulator NtrX
MAAINAEAPALMILDIWLKDSRMDGIDILKTVKRDNPDVPVVIISGHGNIEIAVAAIKQGAYDFIEKPFNIDQLLVVIRRAMETSRLRRENQALRRARTWPGPMMGESPAFRTLVKSQLDKVTKSNGRVMLTGPAGCGKEVAARYIHANSNRATRPSSPSTAPRSSRPDGRGAVRPRNDRARGRAGPAGTGHGGVIYFDEVADMPLGTQSKILRVLVDQQFQRVGGNDKVRVDLRVISSTNRDLEARSPRALPAGAVSPAQRGADRGAVARGAARGHPGAGRAFHRRLNATRACRCAS